MKKTILALSLAAMTLPAMAQKAPEPDYTIEGNFGLFSDYRFRGISQTNLKPALQGGFDYAHKSGFYAGTWASSVSNITSPDGAGMEVDFYAGYAFEVNGVGVDIGNLYYHYPGATADVDTNELYVSLSYGPATFKTSYSTTDYFNSGVPKGTIYYDLSAEFPLSDGMTLAAHVGYVDVKNGDSGTDYKIGLAKEFAGYGFGIDYISNSGAFKDFFNGNLNNTLGTSKNLGKSGVVVSVSKSF
jgi:uncharacterized protein (TIGR02001 family)